MQAESPPTDTHRRLYREPEDKKVAGVCAGLADYYGLDARLVRVGVIVLTLSNGIGLLAYVLATVLIPERPADVPRRPAPSEPLSPKTSNALIVGMVVLTVLAVGSGDMWWFEGPTVGLVLVGLGIWLLVAEREKSSRLTTPSAGRTTLPGEAASQSDLSGNDDRTTVPLSKPDDSTGPRGEVPPPVPPWGPTNTLAAVSTATPADPASAEVPRQQDSVLTGAVGGLLLVGSGILALLVVTGAIDLTASEWIGGGLLVVGLGMIVGAWRGRGRALLGLGAPLLLVLLCGEAVDVPLAAGAGDRQIDVNTMAQLRALDADHEMFAGQLRIDLSDAPLGEPGAPTVELNIHLGLGEIEVTLPDDVTAVVDADVDFGEFTDDNHQESGVDVQKDGLLQGDEGGGRVRLNLHVGLGEIEVRRA